MLRVGDLTRILLTYVGVLNGIYRSDPTQPSCEQVTWCRWYICKKGGAGVKFRVVLKGYSQEMDQIFQIWNSK